MPAPSPNSTTTEEIVTVSNKPNFSSTTALAGIVVAVVPPLLTGRAPGGYVLAYVLLVTFLVALVVRRPR